MAISIQALEESTREVIRRGIATSLYERLSDPDESYFVILGHSFPWNAEDGVLIGGETVPYPTDTVVGFNENYRNAFFAKRVGVNDVRLMLPLFSWRFAGQYGKYSSNTVIFQEGYPFYVYTDEGNVYKCIENGTNADSLSSSTAVPPSTVKPTHKNTDEIVSYSDGYSWKYMYTVPDFDLRLVTAFTEETNYIPVSRPGGNYAYNERILQYDVEQNAVPGTVDSVFISPEAGLSGTALSISVSSARDTYGTSKAKTDYVVAQNSSVGATGIWISGPTLADSGNAYNGYTILLTSGPAAGTYRKITSYDNSFKIVKFSEPLQNAVVIGNEYQIAPTVDIIGDGTGAAGYLKLTEKGSPFGIWKYVVTNNGRNYTTAGVSGPDPAGTLSDFQAHANISPWFGHGGNAVAELNPTYVQICVDINGGETAETLRLADGEFRQIGILKNPRLWNSNLLAGTENPRFHEVFVRSDGLTGMSPVLTEGNYIFGESSKSVGEIRKLRFSGDDLILLVKNLNGNLQATFGDVTGERISLYSHTGAGSQFVRLVPNIGYVLSSTPYLTANATNQVYKLTTTVGVTGASVNSKDYQHGYAYLNGVTGVDKTKFSARIFSVKPSLSAGEKYSIELTSVVGVDHITSSSVIGKQLEISKPDATSSTTFQIVSVDPPAFEPFSGELVYIENTEPKTRDRVQTERVSVLIKI